MRKILLTCLLLFGANVFAQNNYHIEQVWQKSFADSDASDSEPTHITSFNGSVFFIADDDDKSENSIAGGRHLFKLDPKTNDYAVVYFANGEPTSSITDLVLFNQELYFKQGSQIYKFDSTETVKTADSDFVFDVQNFVNLADNIYFIADLGNGRELYIVNNEQPDLVIDINPGAEDGIRSNLVVYKDELYFSGTDGSNDCLFKLTSGTNSLTTIVSYSSDDAFYTPSVTSTNGYLYYNVSGGSEGTRVFSYDGSNHEMIYQEESWQFEELDKAGNKLIINGPVYSEENICQAIDFAHIVTILDPATSGVRCILAVGGSTSFVGATLNYQVYGDDIILDIVEGYGDYTSADIRSIYKLDFNSFTRQELLDYQWCDTFPQDESFSCQDHNYSFAISNGNLYSMSTGGDFGVELASVNIADTSISILDINTLLYSYYNLRPIKAERNLLFLQPYVNDIERAEFSRDYLVYDYLGEITDSPDDWQQGEGFLYRKFGLKPFIYQDKFIPDTAFYKGAVYTNKYGSYINQRALATFNKQDEFYWLGYDIVDGKAEFSLIKAIADKPVDMNYPYGDVEKKALDIDSTGFNHKREPIPNALVDNSFYFALPYSSKLERLYRHNLDTNETTLVEEYDRQRAKVMAATEEAVYMLKQDATSLGLYRLDGDEVTLIDSVFSVELEAGLKALNGDIYYIGIRSAGTTARLYKWSPQEKKITDMLAARNDLIPQSFSYFDDKLFLTAQDKTSGTYDLFSLEANGETLSKHELGEDITKPLDLIRYARGLYFQAENADGIPSVYNLTIDDTHQFPTVESSEAKGTARQGSFYTSSLIASDVESDDVNVFVFEPEWLSYNEATLQFEGTVPQEHWDLGEEEVTAIVDDGDLLTVVNYPLYLEEILSFYSSYDYSDVAPAARFNKSWKMKFNFRTNVDTGEPLIFNMKITRSDTGEEIDWLSYDEETQIISGFIPNLDMDFLSIGFNVVASKGSATANVNFSVEVEPLRTISGTLTEEVIDVELGSSTEYQVEYVTNSNSLRVGEFSIARADGGELPTFISIDEDSGLLTVSPSENYSDGNIMFGITAFSNSHGFAIYAEGEIRFSESSGDGSGDGSGNGSGDGSENNKETDTKKSGGAFYLAFLLLPFVISRRLSLIKQNRI